MSSIADRSRSHANDARDHLRQSLFTGLAITVPLLVTLLVISLVAGFVFGSLDPLVKVLEQMLGANNGTPRIVLEFLAILVVLGGIIMVGFAAERRSSNGRLEARFDRAMGNIPGVGSVYRTFDEMSELVLDADTDSFEEVKLVPFPTEQSYALGFVTAETPEIIEGPTGNDDMQTLYVPMSPNPVMGGYVIHISTDRIIDIDMSVEEGIKSIMTSGVATGSNTVTPDDSSFVSSTDGSVTEQYSAESENTGTGTGEPES